MLGEGTLCGRRLESSRWEVRREEVRSKSLGGRRLGDNGLRFYLLGYYFMGGWLVSTNLPWRFTTEMLWLCSKHPSEICQCPFVI